MYPVRQSTTFRVPVFVCDSSGNGVNVTSPTFRLRKPGSNSASITPTWSQDSSITGLIEVQLTASHTDTVGVNVLQVTHTGAIPQLIFFWVTPAQMYGNLAVQGDQMALVDSAITSTKFAANAITASAIATDAIGSAQLAASAVTEIAGGILLNTANKLYTDASGNVRVGAYATGQSPADHVLANPANKLVTNASGYVTVAVNQDKSGYGLTVAERGSIASAVWDYVVEGTYTMIQMMRMAFAVLFGKRSVSGTNWTYYASDDTTVRVAGTVDSNRNRNITSRNG